MALNQNKKQNQAGRSDTYLICQPFSFLIKFFLNNGLSLPLRHPFPCERELHPIHDLIHQSTQHDTGHHVQGGVLLQEHGRQDDGNHQYKGTAVNQAIAAKLRVIYHSPVGCNGIEYMDTRENVRRGIRLVQNLHRKGEDIVPWKLGGPQQVSVRIDGGDYQKQCHSGKQEETVAVKLFFRSLEEQIQEYGGNVYKP